ncbi:MAG: MFS transporter, partial [Pseudomonadota bacterium]
GMAPAGIIVALTGQSMSAEARAFGMGVFFAAYFFIATPAPAIAGWLFDLTGDAFAPIIFAAALFAATAFANIFFRLVQRRSEARA